MEKIPINKSVDVVIIGTGPAGGMAASRLARTGLKVAIVEKQTLPRHKACGGLMPGSVKSMFDWDISPFIENTVASVQFLYNYEKPWRGSRENEPLLLVNRAKFDRALIEYALNKGKGNLELIENFNVDNVLEHEQSVVVSDKDRGSISAKYLIAADGVASKTARCLGLNNNCLVAPSIDAEVRVSDTFFEKNSKQLLFNYFCLPDGYGWIFPKADNVLSCGVGTWDKNADIKKALSEFITRSIPSKHILGLKKYGFPIPIYTVDETIASSRVCLVGDAARLVDPVSGEGIRFALISGSIAAKTVDELIKQPSRVHDDEQSIDCGIYQQRIHAEIGKHLGNKYKYERLSFLQAPEYYYKRFIIGQSSGLYK